MIMMLFLSLAIQLCALVWQFHISFYGANSDNLWGVVSLLWLSIIFLVFDRVGVR